MEQNSFLYLLTKVFRLALYPFTLIYGCLVWLRNRLYDVKFFNSISFSLPVICVGNLSTGGTGKTPHIEYLIDLLQYQYRVATMSRGYKRFTKGFLLAGPETNALKIGDEPMQYYLKYPEAVISVAEERLTGIPTLLQRRQDVEVILLDDAYQHRSVRAGLNILISDYAHPFYEDHILPFGNLREGREAYKRAEIIIISKCPASLSTKEADQIRQRINPLPNQQVYFTTIQYGDAYHLFSREPLSLKQKNALLVCGIAKPGPLVAYVETLASKVHTLTYADHHYFVTTDVEEIKAAYNNWGDGDKVIVTTEKDAARLLLHHQQLQDWGVPIAVLPIQVAVLFSATDALNTTVHKYVERTIADNYPTDEQPEAGESTI
jgi:tetraacyldisaccharide 4'-kinase